MFSSLFNKISDHKTLYERFSEADTISQAIKLLNSASKRMQKGNYGSEDKDQEQDTFEKTIDTALHYRKQITQHEPSHRFDAALCRYISNSVQAGYKPGKAQTDIYYSYISHDAVESTTYDQHANYLEAAALLNNALSLTETPEKYSSPFHDKISRDTYRVLDALKQYTHEKTMLLPVLHFHQSSCDMGHVFENSAFDKLSNYYKRSAGGENAGVSLSGALSKAAARFKDLEQINNRRKQEKAHKAEQQKPKTVMPANDAMKPKAKENKTPTIKKLKR